jgi:antitoxin CcdA
LVVAGPPAEPQFSRVAATTLAELVLDVYPERAHLWCGLLERIMNNSPKRAVNVKAKGDLVSEAKTLGINLSATFEGALETAVRAARIARWQAENHEAFAAYDKRVAAKGLFSAGKRRF